MTDRPAAREATTASAQREIWSIICSCGAAMVMRQSHSVRVWKCTSKAFLFLFSLHADAVTYTRAEQIKIGLLELMAHACTHENKHQSNLGQHFFIQPRDLLDQIPVRLCFWMCACVCGPHNEIFSSDVRRRQRFIVGAASRAPDNSIKTFAN